MKLKQIGLGRIRLLDVGRISRRNERIEIDESCGDWIYGNCNEIVEVCYEVARDFEY